MTATSPFAFASLSLKAASASSSTPCTAGSTSHAGRGIFAIHGTRNDLYAALTVEAVYFYFLDISVAKAFVERFACGLALFTLSGIDEAPTPTWQND
jgi:hypothetical protein